MHGGQRFCSLPADPRSSKFDGSRPHLGVEIRQRRADVNEREAELAERLRSVVVFVAWVGKSDEQLRRRRLVPVEERQQRGGLAEQLAQPQVVSVVVHEEGEHVERVERRDRPEQRRLRLGVHVHLDGVEPAVLGLIHERRGAAVIRRQQRPRVLLDEEGTPASIEGTDTEAARA
eukprot:2604483-Pleurochrysis_carterae.AAC.2